MIVMQTLGTSLQLTGSVITFGGLLYAWYVTSGRLRRWGVAAGNLVVGLRSALRRSDTVKRADVALTAEGALTVETEKFVSGTLDQRLHTVENDADVIRTRLDRLPDALRDEMRDEFNDAIAAALQEFSDLTNAAELRDIYPALFGILVSISGYLVTLFC